ncbi:hypothetical protein RQP46_009933 [Phenoliferia psychrophenolica]
MQDLTRLTAGMSLSDTTDVLSSLGTAVSEDVAHSILLQLDPQDPTTVSTILTCRLVSRSFDAAAQSASVWRPLVQQRWKAGEPEYTKLPNALDQALMDLAINSSKLPISPCDVYRARTLVDRIALQAAARRGDSVDKEDRIESYDTIAMLGTQVYDAIIRLKTVSPEERHDYLSIRRVAHELEPTLTRGISMGLWRDAFDDKRSDRVTLDAMYKSLAPFGTPWKTFDEIESGLQRLAKYCYQHIELLQAYACAQGVDLPLQELRHFVAASVWHSLEILGYKAPYAMQARLHLVGGLPCVTLAEKDDPLGNERWVYCFPSGGLVEDIALQNFMIGQPEEVRRAVDPCLPSDVCISLAECLVKSSRVQSRGNMDQSVLVDLSCSVIVYTLAFLPSKITESGQARSEEPALSTLIPLESFLSAVFRLFATDAFLVRKHIHTLLSAPTHLREFDRMFDAFLSTRKIIESAFDYESTHAIRPTINGLREFEVGEACIRVRLDDGGEEFDDLVNDMDTLEEQKSRVLYHVIIERGGVEANAALLRRLQPSDERQWRAAYRVIQKRGLLGECFSSISSLEYPTFVKTKAWAAIYPDE